ncbi:MAG: hypothetical protein KGJ35_03310, partial [Patescibacteria group bacterium]|nr:hypothetical protein [Patescibacteria group bacterium]
LGGRYDATNIIKNPLVTAITNISLDHTAVLGSNRIDIATDKSGIIKKGSAFFTTEEDSKIRYIFKDRCALVQADYHFLSVKGLDYEFRNRLLARSICSHLGVTGVLMDLSVTPNLPARFEIIKRRPYIIIDGAHNPAKIKSTTYNLSRLRYKKLFLVIAVSADKDWKTMLKFMIPKASVIFVTRFSVPGRQAVSPKLLMHEARKHASTKDAVCLYSDPIQAYKSARRLVRPDDVLLVTGSFYLAGDIRSLYCSEEKILKQRNSKII